MSVCGHVKWLTSLLRHGAPSASKLEQRRHRAVDCSSLVGPYHSCLHFSATSILNANHVQNQIQQTQIGQR